MLASIRPLRAALRVADDDHIGARSPDGAVRFPYDRLVPLAGG